MKRQRCKHCGARLQRDFDVKPGADIGYYCGTMRCPWMQRWLREMWDTVWYEIGWAARSAGL